MVTEIQESIEKISEWGTDIEEMLEDIDSLKILVDVLKRKQPLAAASLDSATPSLTDSAPAVAL